MKILVTGVAGFIGSNLADFLLNKGYTVVGIDNFNDYYSPKIKEFNIESFKNNKNFVLYRTDITVTSDLEKVFKENRDIKAIIHLAAWAGVTYSVKNPLIYEKNNVYGTTLLSEFAVKNNISNFIFASTSSVYGNNKTPFIEDMDTSTPNAPYPATKKASEVLLYTYSLNYDLNVTIFRFFNPLGPKLRPDMALPKLVRSALYSTDFPVYTYPGEKVLGGKSRDYTYVIDMIKAIEFTINNPFKYEIMNLGNSNPVSLNDLIENVEKVSGNKIKLVKEIRQGEMEETFANINKAKNLVNYSPSTSLSEMVDIYYNWFIKQPEWYQKGDY